MNAKKSNDEFGVFWFCDLCLLDHEDAASANKCCKELLAKPVDMTGCHNQKPMTERQLDYITKPHPSVYARKQ
jgi:hypothetical protein